MRRSNIIAFGAGAVVGSGVSLLILKRYFTKVCKEEVDAARQDYQRAIDAMRVQDVVVKSEPIEKENKPKAKTKTKAPVSPAMKEEYENEIQKTNYSAISTAEAHVVTLPETPVAKPKKTNRKKSDKPEIITMEEYNANRTHDHLLVTYLDQEDMFVAEGGEILEHFRDEVGMACTDIDYSQDGEAVYVRNDSLGKVYEIILNVTDTYESFCEEE